MLSFVHHKALMVVQLWYTAGFIDWALAQLVVDCSTWLLSTVFHKAERVWKLGYVYVGALDISREAHIF